MEMYYESVNKWRHISKAIRKKTISTFLCFASFENGRFPIPKTGTKIPWINWIYGIWQKLRKLTKHTKNRPKTYIFNLKTYVWGPKCTFWGPYIQNIQKWSISDTQNWYKNIVYLSVLNICKKIDLIQILIEYSITITERIALHISIENNWREN
jgi:hypothetical protein